MWRYLVGAAAALLLVAAGLVWQRGGAQQIIRPAPARPLAADAAADPLTDPPSASEATREEKRFSRYDRDRDGKVSADEFLLARRHAFVRLDTNGDGKLSFEEYAVKSLARFAAADGDRSSGLDAAEFAKTRLVRHDKPRCPPAGATAPADPDDG